MKKIFVGSIYLLKFICNMRIYLLYISCFLFSWEPVTDTGGGVSYVQSPPPNLKNENEFNQLSGKYPACMVLIHLFSMYSAVTLSLINVYITGNLCNQALCIMTEHFSHFTKCLPSRHATLKSG